jgi:hypothetical protein
MNWLFAPTVAGQSFGTRSTVMENGNGVPMLF